jgi:hypothetical protein
MLGRICFAFAVVLFLLEALGVVNRPMIAWGLFCLALGLAVSGWNWPWGKNPSP